MKGRLSKFLRQPWLVTLRRLVMLWCVFILLIYLACYVDTWERDFYGNSPVYAPIAIVAVSGFMLVPLAGLVLVVRTKWKQRRRRRRAAQESAKAKEAEVQLELPLCCKPTEVKPKGLLRRFWDIWFLLLTAAVCIPLCSWYAHREATKSTLSLSCQGQHGNAVFARAEWQSPNALADGVEERLPAAAPYLHQFRLPDGDFFVNCRSGKTSFHLSHIRRTRRFTLKPHFDIQGEIDLYICPIVKEADQRRVHTLLNYYMENPEARRPRIRRMQFERCQDAAVLYLDYGEYVLLPVPRGTEPSDAPALIYFSLLPSK